MGFVIFALASTLIIEPNAKGSGIPKVKAIMQGLCLPKALNYKTLIAKVFGTLGMLCSGMSMGREGPFVHISACIASILPYYK